MGRVKAWAQDEFEKSLATKEKEADWVKHGMANQQDWAQYEAEFNAWLDAYEKSFSVRGELP